jgi:hypothetical protein
MALLALILWTSPFIIASMASSTAPLEPEPEKVPANSPVLSDMPPPPAPASPNIRVSGGAKP